MYAENREGVLSALTFFKVNSMLKNVGGFAVLLKIEKWVKRGINSRGF
jgi:hypothetical protein